MLNILLKGTKAEDKYRSQLGTLSPACLPAYASPSPLLSFRPVVGRVQSWLTSEP